jgi:hypothetical protein
VTGAESGSPHWTHLELLLPKSSVAQTPATPAADQRDVRKRETSEGEQTRSQMAPATAPNLKINLLPLLDEYLAQGYVGGFAEPVRNYQQWIRSL